MLPKHAIRPVGHEAVKECAAETSERLIFIFCTRFPVDLGMNALIIAGLPKITANGQAMGRKI